MAFESGTDYPESDADDEYERSVHPGSPIATDDETSPTDSDGLSSNEHTPTTYGAHSSGDRLPETIISEWTADECADFVTSLGYRQYGDQFIGMAAAHRCQYDGTDILQRTKLLVKRWWHCSMRT